MVFIPQKFRALKENQFTCIILIRCSTIVLMSPLILLCISSMSNLPSSLSCCPRQLIKAKHKQTPSLTQPYCFPKYTIFPPQKIFHQLKKIFSNKQILELSKSHCSITTALGSYDNCFQQQCFLQKKVATLSASNGTTEFLRQIFSLLSYIHTYTHNIQIKL